ncbi:MAG: hypothetical protein AABZ83_12340 [candidate division NC10 bacterium]
MPRPHKRQTRRRRSTAHAARRPKPQRAPRPTSAETHLLRLAREITGLPLAAAIETLTAAWAPGAALPRDVAQAFLKSRGDKTAALALAWAREQVRLALEEIVAARPKPQRRRIEAGPDLLAWLLLAACESIAHEPPSAVVERVSAILELSGHGATAG